MVLHTRIGIRRLELWLVWSKIIRMVYECLRLGWYVVARRGWGRVVVYRAKKHYLLNITKPSSVYNAGAV